MIDFEGDFTFAAPRELIWSLLHDQVALRAALPGCDYVVADGAGNALVALRVALGPLQGHYHGRVTVADAQSPTSFTLALGGSGEGLSFEGDGRFVLAAQGKRTRLRYTGQVRVADPHGRVTTRLLQTTANALVRQYLEALDDQARARLGVPLAADEPAPDAPLRRASTIGMGDWLAEVRRDRQIALVLAAAALAGTLSLVGAAVLVVWFGRWSTRRYARHLAGLVKQETTRQAGAAK